MFSTLNREQSNLSVNQCTVIKINGIINTIAFQKARWCALMLHDRLPLTFAMPKIRELFQMEWCNYLEKTRRHIGGRMWLLNRPVSIFINDDYIGSDIDFINCVNEIYVMCLPINSNFYEELIVDNLKRIIGKLRKFVYFTFTVDDAIIGSFLFMLYSDILPQTCEYFFNLCVGSGTKLLASKNFNYENSSIHRIVKNRWLQLGDIETGDDTEELTTLDESQFINHDCRGVLSLSNNGTHRNGPQFIVCLNPNPWMDKNYVAIGQLMDGARTLKKIEDMPTHYEAPVQKIIISRCGEYFFGDEPKLEMNPDIFLDNEDSFRGEMEDGTTPSSIMSIV